MRNASLFFLLLIASGCRPGNHDYYAEIMPACDYVVPDAGSRQMADPTYTSLTPECKAALEEILPFDSSFDDASESFKDHVTEAFQFLAAYPMAMPPEGKVLGIRPDEAGSIPLSLSTILMESDDWNRNAFNYVMNRIDTISYGGMDTHAAAKYQTTLEGRFLKIYDGFFPVSPVGALRSPLAIRATTLIHEARHGDDVRHFLCKSDDPDIDGRWDCDWDLSGAYGVDLGYLELLIHGSEARALETGVRPIPTYEIVRMGHSICHTLRRMITPTPVVFDQALPENCFDIDIDWMRDQEGLAIDSP